MSMFESAEAWAAYEAGFGNITGHEEHDADLVMGEWATAPHDPHSREILAPLQWAHILSPEVLARAVGAQLVDLEIDGVVDPVSIAVPASVPDTYQQPLVAAA
jgi:hypothetical protein